MTIEGSQAEREGICFKDSKKAQLKGEIESDRWWEMEFYFKVLGLGQMTKWNSNSMKSFGWEKGWKNWMENIEPT